MRRSDLNPPPSRGDGAAFDHPPLKGEGRTAAGSPGWGGGDAGVDGGAAYTATRHHPTPDTPRPSDPPPACARAARLPPAPVSPQSCAATAAFDEPALPGGRIFAASHSGGMIGTLLSRGKACGIGFAGLVSVGNEVDLSLGEICDAVLGDPEIAGFLLFLETLRHADALRAFAQRAAAAGKPILAYKLGRSPQPRELPVTHTRALA